MPPHLRVARPTDHMDDVIRFYRDGLGLEMLGAFEDHAGFDGVMLGQAGAAYHLEFTRRRGHTAVLACQSNSSECGPSVSANQLLVVHVEPSFNSPARSW